MAASILREGNTNLDEFRRLMDPALDYRLRTIADHIYYYYPAATPLMVAPALPLLNLVFSARGSPDFYAYLDAHAPDQRTANLERLIASAIVGASAVFMYLVARQSASTPVSLGITVIFAFGTSMWSTASRALWQHGPSVLLLLIALYLTLRVPTRSWAAFAVGLLLAFAYLVRPTNSLSFAFFGLYYLLNIRERAWIYVVGAAAVLGPFVLSNIATFGNPFPPYSYQLFERLATPTEFIEALAGTLVSPNRGLFVFTPVFLFSIYGAVQLIRRGALAPGNLSIFLAAIVLSHWIITSLFEDWGGAWSIGPRYFVEVIPYLMYFLIPVLADAGWATRAWQLMLGMSIVLGLMIQFHCATSIYPFMWNGKPRALVEAPERKWDWADLQFLRGLCASDPLEGRAPACWIHRID